MTRYPPQGPPQGEYGYGSGSGQDYYQQTPQYGEQQPQYGQYGSPAPQHPGYGAPPQQPYGQPSHQNYGGDQGGSYGGPQSYYGSNEQPYQQYPADSQSQYHGDSFHQGPPPQDRQAYGGGYGDSSYQPPQHQQAHQGYGGYGYPPAQGGPEVEAFKSHFDAPNQPYGQPAPAYGQAPYAQAPYGAPPGAEQDRGLMGALGGAAAGGFAGHKVNHGFLGTVGGAIAGSVLEDKFKDKKKKDKKEKKQHKQRRGSSSSSSSSSSSDSGKHHRGGSGALAGNYTASSRHARLVDDERVLVAEVADCNGHHRESQIDLNDCLTNMNGDLRWARGGNFRASSRHVRLVDGGEVLEAELGDGRGGWRYNAIRLNGRISNEDGRLVML